MITATDEKVKQIFLDWVEKNASPALAYRIDDWTIWQRCAEDPHAMTCSTAGMTIGLGPRPTAPFVVFLATIPVFGTTDLDVAWNYLQRRAEEISYYNWHIHAFGWPCHDACSCEAILEEF